MQTVRKVDITPVDTFDRDLVGLMGPSVYKLPCK